MIIPLDPETIYEPSTPRSTRISGAATSPRVRRPAGDAKRARSFLAKQELCSPGWNRRRGVQRLDNTLQIESAVGDGEVIPEAKSSRGHRREAQTLLASERVALNFLQHLSGLRR
jgi:nicotinate-nucleotide pyrophosphorylase